MATARETAERVIANVEKVIIGKHTEVERALIALICQGHLLIEDVPGVGKTVLAKSIARSLGCTFKRIQFTPDLLPTDVTGVSIFNQKTGEFEFRPGPIFAQIVLADEINRATPKTQSALLEAMDERQTTVDGNTYAMDKPFLVLATQNPIEYEGTFPLPEAQLDRFMMRLALGYPSHEDEMTILANQEIDHPLDTLDQVVSPRELIALQDVVRREVRVDEMIRGYIVAIAAATRKHAEVYLGASPRGSIALRNAARALAALRGRDFVIPDDVKELAEPTLAHRIIVSPSARIKNITTPNIIADVLSSIPAPGVRVRA